MERGWRHVTPEDDSSAAAVAADVSARENRRRAPPRDGPTQTPEEDYRSDPGGPIATMISQAPTSGAGARTVPGEEEPDVATRLSVNITDETADALKTLAKEKGTTVTDIVRQATGLLKFIDTELKDPNQILQIRNIRTNETSRIQLL